MKPLFFALLIISLINLIAVGQKTEAYPISYRISLVKINRNKREIVINATLSNTTDKTILIDKYNLTFRTVYKRDGVHLKNGVVTEGRSSTTIAESPFEPSSASLFAIGPYQQFSKTLILKLTDDFFLTGRNYKLMLIYGQFREIQRDSEFPWKGSVNSNELRFRL